VFELSTAVVKVDVKVIYASLTQNQCLQCVTPPLMHVEYRDCVTPLNWTMTAWSSCATYNTTQNRIYQFIRKRL